MYKTRNNISNHIMNELFEQRNIIYNLRSQTDFTTGPISTVTNPAGNCMFKVNNRNTRTRCEICSKLTIKTPERR